MSRELNGMPETIERLESEQSEIEARFCDLDYFQRAADAFQKDQQRLKELERELAAACSRWEGLESIHEQLALKQ